MADSPRLPNDPDSQIDSTLLVLVERYAGCDARSLDINHERTEIRKDAMKLGFSSIEFQHAVLRAKKMTKSERAIYDRNVNRIIGVVEGRQAEFWPAEVKAAERRQAKRDEENKGWAGAPEPGTDPKGDPNRGGVALDKKRRAQQAAEQKEGGKIVDIKTGRGGKKKAEAAPVSSEPPVPPAGEAESPPGDKLN